MDSTLPTDEKRIPQRNLDALGLLVVAGREFAPCTDRTWTGVPTEALHHHVARYILQRTT